MDLRIDVINDIKPIPKIKLNIIWFNFFGVKDINLKILEYLATVCEKQPDAKKVILNINDKLANELKIFSIIHKVQFIDKENK